MKRKNHPTELTSPPGGTANAVGEEESPALGVNLYGSAVD